MTSESITRPSKNIADPYCFCALLASPNVSHHLYIILVFSVYFLGTILGLGFSLPAKQRLKSNDRLLPWACNPTGFVHRFGLVYDL